MVEYEVIDGKKSIKLKDVRVGVQDFWGDGENKQPLNRWLRSHIEQMMYSMTNEQLRMITEINCRVRSISPYKK